MNALHKRVEDFTVTEGDLEFYDNLYAIEARESFWAFRRYMDPTMQLGWWPHLVSIKLQEFFDKLVAGERPKLLLEAPPQHGKSRALEDFSAWMAGKRPDWREIYASFSDDLGVRANTMVQRIMDSDKYKRVFPQTILRPHNAHGDEQMFQRNSSYLEWVYRKGSFRNVTVQGQVTGKTSDWSIIDDPLKGREAAQSLTVRNKTWNWLTDDFMTRFADQAGMIMTMTRWHVDDPAGRLHEYYPEAEVLKFPAVATEDCMDVKLGYRKPGEALFPEFKSLPFLLSQKKASSQASWASLYQQSPIVVGGGMFPIENFKIVPHMPSTDDIRKSVRYWDKAATQDGGAYTAGVLMHALRDGKWIVEHVRRGQWNRYDRERYMKAQAEADDAKYGRVHIFVEREPGSGGKDSAEASIANLAGHSIKEDRVTGSKELRADPYAGQVQGGNIMLLAGKWNQEFIDEHETFPSGKYKDQVDAAAGAFTQLVKKKYNYDTTMNWVDGPGED